jgi:hypothetical protein
LLLFVFIGALFTPQGNDWVGNISNLFSGNGWTLDNASIIKQLTQAGLKEQLALATDPLIIEQLNDKMFFANLARMILLSLFIFIGLMVYYAFLKRRKEGRATL